MHVATVSLDELREELKQLDKLSFLERYPGAFLLAMGLLAVEKILAGKGRLIIGGSSKGREDPTAALVFGERLRHDAGQTHPLAGVAFFIQPVEGENLLRIGRSEDADIIIPDPSVSETHCRIEVTPEGVMVCDEGSTNGTSINLEKLEPLAHKLIADEDILTVGRCSFQLLSANTLFDELSLTLTLEQDEEAAPPEE